MEIAALYAGVRGVARKRESESAEKTGSESATMIEMLLVDQSEFIIDEQLSRCLVHKWGLHG